MTQLSLHNQIVLKNAIIAILQEKGACSAVRISKLIISSKPRGLQGKSLTMMRITSYLRRLRTDGVIETHGRVWSIKTCEGEKEE
jgi:hypothetical protein